MSRKPVPFVPSPIQVVEKMLSLAEVDEGELVYDLGCGDGRVLFTAARRFRANAVGCEIRPQLVTHVRNKIRNLRLDDRIRIVRKDMFTTPLYDADVITLYLTSDMLGKLRPKLEAELKPMARVVCHDFPIPGWTPVHWERSNGHTVYLYRKPRI
jgi:cyclopropane fatty-acyl-phospholipid synthase-like methyltransferase